MSQHPHQPSGRAARGRCLQASGRAARGRRLQAAIAGLALVWAAGCASDEGFEFFEDVAPEDELYEEGMELLEGTRYLGILHLVDYDEAIETFQTIIDNYPYSEYAVKSELRIADAYYDDDRYDESLSYYRDFADLHPQHDRVPYTMLRAALCHYNQIEAPNRDQTATREALAALERLIDRFPYAAETREGEDLLRNLRSRLARSVMDVGDFYLARTDYQAAATRFRSVLDSFPGLGLDAEALYKLGVSYEHMRRHDEALRLYLVIVENFRETDLSALAADRISAFH